VRKSLGFPSGPIRPSIAMPKAPRIPRSAKYPGDGHAKVALHDQEMFTSRVAVHREGT
jgi:hypothetical protein